MPNVGIEPGHLASTYYRNLDELVLDRRKLGNRKQVSQPVTFFSPAYVCGCSILPQRGGVCVATTSGRNCRPR